MRPTVVPDSIVEARRRAAPRSPPCARFDRPKLTSRSLSDLSLRMTNRLETSFSVTTVVDHSSCAKLPCRRANTRWPTHSSSTPITRAMPSRVPRSGGYGCVRARHPERPLEAEHGERHRVGEVELGDPAADVVPHHRPGVDDRRGPEQDHEHDLDEVLHVAQVDVDGGEQEGEREPEDQEDRERQRQVPEVGAHRRVPRHDGRDDQDDELDREVEQRAARGAQREDLARQVDLLDETAVDHDRLRCPRARSR